MIFNEYWAELCKKNPALNVPNNTMRMSVESFKKQIEKAYHEGADSRKKTNGFVDELMRKAGMK